MDPEVLVVRHAPSTWNGLGRWQGRSDPPLSPAGEAMARAAAQHLGPVDLVVTSGLARAVRTGKLLAGYAPSAVEVGLAEYDVGRWSGLTRDEIGRRWPSQLAAFDRGELAAPPGGERRVSFEQRVGAAAARVAGIAVQARAARVLLVTHGGVIRALCRLGGRGEHHIEHLCGFHAVAEPSGLVLSCPLCLSGPVLGDPPGDLGPRPAGPAGPGDL